MELYETMYSARCKAILREQGELKNYHELNDYKNFKDIMDSDTFSNIIRAKNKRQKKRYRVDKKLLEIVKASWLFDNPKIVFGTLTLKDNVLDLKENTYIRKIHKYLKSHYVITILNKDFGKKNEREHYHFIAITNENIINTGIKSKSGFDLYKLEKQDYELGFEPTIEVMNLEDKREVRNYLLKLNNHSTKNTTKNSRFRVLYNPLFKVCFELKKTY